MNKNNDIMTLYVKYLNEFQNKYTLYFPLMIAIQSCVGSIAAMYILMNGLQEVSNLVQLFICVILTMAFNAAVLAQVKGKLVFNLLLLSLFGNALLILFNAI